MNSFADALREINSLKGEGLVHSYAVAGAMAMVFWTEPVPTYDLDVLVSVPEKMTGSVSLDALYTWAAAKGFPVSQEHIIIHGVPTQLLPSPGPLADEAIQSAAGLEYEGVKVRVVKPEYLIALYLDPSARTARRRERAALLMELPGLNRGLLQEIMKRHGLQF